MISLANSIFSSSVSYVFRLLSSLSLVSKSSTTALDTNETEKSNMPSSPPPPNPSIEWDKLGLAVDDIVNGHIETTFSTKTGQWTTPKFISDPFLRVHGLSPALNYGMQAFEGVKACRIESGAICIFRPQFHAKRMAHSAETVSMPEVPEALFMKCIDEAVRRNAEFVGPFNSNAILYIRPLLFGSGPQLALEAPSHFTFAVYVQPATTYHGTQALPAMIMEDFDRTATRGTGHAKVGGNYAPVMKWSRAAKAEGFYLTLHLDSATQTEIDEFSTSGFIGVKMPPSGSNPEQKPTLVIPSSPSIIASVTSASLVHLAANLGYTIERRAIPVSELSSFSEVLAVGTAASVLPIACIVRKKTGDKWGYLNSGNGEGVVASELKEAFAKVIRGEGIEGDLARKWGWLWEVEF